MAVKLPRPDAFPKDVVEIVVWTDSDWAGETRERKSQTSVHIQVDGCPMAGISCRQDVISLSSCEAEWHAGARGLSEALGLKALYEFLGFVVRMVWRCDSSSARALAKRQGTGRIKHLATKTLWIQELVKQRLCDVEPVAGSDNIADLGTKTLPKERLEWLRESCGIVRLDAEGGRGNAGHVRAVNAQTPARAIQLAMALLALCPALGDGYSTDVATPYVCGTQAVDSTTGPWWLAFVLTAVVALAVGVVLGRLSTRWVADTAFDSRTMLTRTVATQSQCTYKWNSCTPHFRLCQCMQTACHYSRRVFLY